MFARPYRGSVLAIALGLSVAPAAYAIEEISVEENIAELLPQHRWDEGGSAETRQWAVLPEVGFAPDTGPLVGAKFTHRDLFDTGTTFDIEGTYALKKQQGLSAAIAQPFLGGEQFLAAFRVNYRFDPEREFFGLGNNDQGPDPASTNSFQDLNGSLTFGWRPFFLRRVALNLSVGLRKIHVGPGDQRNQCGPDIPCPRTPDAFPDLPGVDGGVVNPIALSLVWNNRDDVVRPTRGWRFILKVIHTNKALLSDFEYTRYIADLGYLQSFFDNRLLTGLRLDGEWVDGPDGSVPYWELAELGGDDTMRGYFPHRFLGKGRALVNLEVKGLITEFDFFDIWHIKLDGVIFGDAGRVFLSAADAQEQFRIDPNSFAPVANDFRYSYGGGLRFALGKALVARIDVGFSDEETGLVYLSFGQTF